MLPIHILSILEAQTKEQLEKYALERGQSESSLFTLAEDNLTVLKQESLQRLKESSKQDPREEFARLFVKYKDGVTRNRPKSFNYRTHLGSFREGLQLKINAVLQ